MRIGNAFAALRILPLSGAIVVAKSGSYMGI
ncbi:hypothetical protein CCUS01_14312 [Colletotrichum cuscutae]|uniref:Uncharacterized protein n=1 Tax=Colletotrichum cuscutae TaxID=1209917 RepID=A0AAI9Y9A7_9PEZI|nr:hypothetical protein CCUS01_14312 [Colletotrichum cuscutae]